MSLLRMNNRFRKKFFVRVGSEEELDIGDISSIFDRSKWALAALEHYLDTKLAVRHQGICAQIEKHHRILCRKDNQA